MSLPALVAVANMLAMVFLDSQFTNNDSRNDLRFADHVQHPVQKQGRPVPNQRSGQSEWLSNIKFLALLVGIALVVLIPFLRKLITDKAETPPVEAATVV